MGYIILFIIIVIAIFAIVAWFMQQTSPDDRDDAWWIPGRTSGPFYWRKRWMGHNERMSHDEFWAQVDQQDTFQEPRPTSNIRAKQKHDDWDDVKTMYYVRELNIKEDNLGNVRAAAMHIDKSNTYDITSEQLDRIFNILREVNE